MAKKKRHTHTHNRTTTMSKRVVAYAINGPAMFNSISSRYGDSAPMTHTSPDDCTNMGAVTRSLRRLLKPHVKVPQKHRSCETQQRKKDHTLRRARAQESYLGAGSGTKQFSTVAVSVRSAGRHKVPGGMTGAAPCNSQLTTVRLAARNWRMSPFKTARCVRGRSAPVHPHPSIQISMRGAQDRALRANARADESTSSIWLIPNERTVCCMTK